MRFENESRLDDFLSEPGPGLVEMMREIDGDVMILGVAGKMGLTLARMARLAVERAGVVKKVVGVSRFSEKDAEDRLKSWGVETIRCDLLDREAVARLPDVKNVVYMAGRKFGTDGSEELTWAMNVTVPGHVAEKFCGSRIVVFSTGCVYPLVAAACGGCDERVVPSPVGEYAQSCLGRERVFGHFCKKNKTPTLLLRLNYAVDLRYGVLFDIASKIWEGAPVSRSVSHFNALWQGDANNYALLALQHCGVPAVPLNITGPETVSVEWAAGMLAKAMGREVTYADEPGPVAYLNNAGMAFELFGYPSVSLRSMIEWQAEWVMSGGRSLGKPTHFEVNNGKF